MSENSVVRVTKLELVLRFETIHPPSIHHPSIPLDPNWGVAWAQGYLTANMSYTDTLKSTANFSSLATIAVLKQTTRVQCPNKVLLNRNLFDAGCGVGVQHSL